MHAHSRNETFKIPQNRAMGFICKLYTLRKKDAYGIRSAGFFSQSAIAKGSETAKLTLSLQYIDWALAVGGVKSARKVYKKSVTST